MRKKVYIYCLVLLSGLMRAQQLPMYSNYFYKPMVYNPAYTGDKDVTEVFALNRSQFSDFQGAPVFNALAVDGKLQDKKAYLGFLVANQRKGITSNTNAMASYAYRANLQEDVYFKFGLSVGVFDQSINYNKVVVANYSDPSLFTSQQRKTVLDGNAGFSFYLKKLDIGIAIPQLFSGKVNYTDNSDIRSYYRMSRHIAASVKYDIALDQSEEILLSPNIIVRKVTNAPLQYDAGLNLNWKDKFWVGAMYRSNYAIGINAGLTLNRRFSVGYSYDYMMGSIANYAGTSSEIMIAVKLGKLKYRHGDDTLTAQDKQIAELQEEIEDLKNKVAKAGSNQNTNKTPEKLPHANPTQFTGKNAVKEKDVYILTNKASDFTNVTGTLAQKGIYIVVESCFYPEYAETEAKKYISFGFPDSEVIIDKLSKFNYVYIDRATTKEEAFKKVKDAKDAGVPDVWIQILIE